MLSFHGGGHRTLVLKAYLHGLGRESEHHGRDEGRDRSCSDFPRVLVFSWCTIGGERHDK